jgi:hypothetical protein
MTTETKDEALNLSEDFGTDDEYNPLAFLEDETDKELMEVEDLDDLPEYPSIKETPTPPRLGNAFTPQRAGSVKEAMRKLVRTNPGRREVLLTIIDLARDGALASAIDEKVDELQTDNLSVYAAVSLCHMLERAGALRFEMPTVSKERVDVDEGVGYLSISEQVDPVWRSTEEGLAAHEELTQGSEWREVVFATDAVYAEVYLAVMRKMSEGPCDKTDINDLAGTFEITKHPRRFGTHFIDLLEKTCAIKWTNHAWALTDLGVKLLPELVEYCERKAQVARVTTSGKLEA